VREADAARFHASRCHHEGLAGAHLVRQERIAARQDAPDGVLLVRTQRNVCVAAGQHQMTAVVFAQDVGVEVVVVDSHQLIRALGVTPDPRRKVLFHRHLLGDGGLRLVLQNMALPVLILGTEDLQRGLVQRRGKNLLCADLFGSPLPLPNGLDAVHRTRQHPLASGRNVVHSALVVTWPCPGHPLKVLFYYVFRYPGRPESNTDVARLQIGRLHFLQCRDVLLQPSLARLRQFQFDVAAQILFPGNQAPVRVVIDQTTQLLAGLLRGRRE